jgi:3-phenylpropionate/trans-cinnamate dioxygenase ferredoxin subunit
MAILSSQRLSLTRFDELPEGEARVFDVNGESIVLCKVGGQVFAVENRCTHDDGPLGEGSLQGHEIECPRHGARFDVRDGRVLCLPAAHPVRTFSVRVEDGQVFVEPATDGGEV